MTAKDYPEKIIPHNIKAVVVRTISASEGTAEVCN